MRILALAIVVTVAVSVAAPGRAQTYDPNYPVCLQVYQGGFTDYYFECAYTSLPQCNASASGRAAQCIVNPYYAGPKSAPPGSRDIVTRIESMPLSAGFFGHSCVVAGHQDYGRSF